MMREESTVMKPRTFFRHIRQGFQNVGRNFLMSLASITAVAITLFIVGGFTALLFNANKIADDIANDVTIRTSIDLAADDADMDSLEKEILSLEQVESVEFSSKEQELEYIQATYGETYDIFEGDENPLRNVFVVSTYEPEQTNAAAEAIEDLAYVSEVNYGGATTDRLFNFVDNFQMIGLIAAALLLVLAYFLISNTVRMTIAARKDEITIMRLVGATKSYIRWPYIIEGKIIGIIGALLPFAAIILAYEYIYTRSQPFFASANYSMIPPTPFLMYLGAGMLIFGVLIGTLSSIQSMSKYLKI